MRGWGIHPRVRPGRFIFRSFGGGDHRRPLPARQRIARAAAVRSRLRVRGRFRRPRRIHRARARDAHFRGHRYARGRVCERQAFALCGQYAQDVGDRRQGRRLRGQKQSYRRISFADEIHPRAVRGAQARGYVGRDARIPLHKKSALYVRLGRDCPGAGYGVPFTSPHTTWRA